MALNEYDKGDVAILRACFLTKLTTGTIEKGETALLVESAVGYAQGDSILVAGAGHDGTYLVTTIAAIAGTTLTLAKAASSGVVNARVGRLTDPATVTFKVRPPRGAAVRTYTFAGATVTKESVGIYVVNETLDVDGRWKWRPEGTGAAAAAGYGSFVVRPDEVS